MTEPLRHGEGQQGADVVEAGACACSCGCTPLILHMVPVLCAAAEASVCRSASSTAVVDASDQLLCHRVRL